MDGHTLVRWIEGADDIFEAFEGRGDIYETCRNWIEEWFQCRKFCVKEKDKRKLEKEFLEQFKSTLEITINRIRDEDRRSEVKETFLRSMELLIEKIPENSCKLTFAFAPYLISWNIRRFIEYFRNPIWFENLEVDKNSEESLVEYFSKLNEYFNEDLIEIIGGLRQKNIFDSDIEEETIRILYEGLNEKLKSLGIRNDEPVGVIKVLHILSPHYFPLIDNPIARSLAISNVFRSFTLEKENSKKKGRKHVYRICGSTIVCSRTITIYNAKVKLNVDSYIKYMKEIQQIFQRNRDSIEYLEKKSNKSFLKLLDQAFYIRYSIDIARRLKPTDSS